MRRQITAVILLLPLVTSVLVVVVATLNVLESRRQNDQLLLGEGGLVLDRLRRTTSSHLSEAGLASALEQSEVEWAAFVDEAGRVVLEAGTQPADRERALRLPQGQTSRGARGAFAVSPPLGPPTGPPPPPPGPLGLRLPWRAPPRPGPPPGEREAPAPPGGPLHLVAWFQPRYAVQREAGLLAGLVASLLALLAALGLTRLSKRLLAARDAALAQLERDRHLAALGNMAAVVVHELRNPLASLKGHAQLLLEGLPADSRPEREQATHVVEGAIRLERLASSLLDLARATTLQREPSDVAALVRATVSDPRVSVEVRGEARASVDPLRFTQVVTNLVDNALQAARSRVEVLVDGTPATTLVVEVRDDGPGVPLAERERIFEPFVTTRVTGTGLGLSIARKLVELHGGRLSLLDRTAGGACFRVELPREDR
jgi:two-component system sensor histidine kinase HydH